MTADIPCIRHGHASTHDPRIVDALDHARALGLDEPAGRLTALLDYEGQLWATWRDGTARDGGSALLTRAWAMAGGDRGTLHLIRSEDDYDYQEDCMNDASA